MTSDARGRRGCLVAALVFSGAVIVGFMIWVALVRRIPEDAPLARMYRTEADLRALMTAVETYRKACGAYPPGGDDGLRLAAEHLSGIAGYFPAGPQPDAWGHRFRYVPCTQYGEPDSGALRGRDGYCAAQTYQLYSAGADGDAGLDDAANMRDNICSWDPSRSWRLVYHELHAAYMRTRREGP